MQRKCLEKWDGQKVLVLGTVQKKVLNGDGKLTYCLEDVDIALYGEGKPEKIDHLWLFTDLEENQLTCFGSSDLERETPAKMPILGIVHPYWRRSIRAMDYGVRYLDIYRGDFHNVNLIVNRYNELLGIEKEIVAPLLRSKEKIIRANHKIFSYVIENYHQYLNECFVSLNNGGRSIGLLEYISELELILERKTLVFDPFFNSETIRKTIEKLRTCYRGAKILFELHKHNAPKPNRRKRPKRATGFAPMKLR